MYFVIRCNYTHRVEDKVNIGFFSSLDDAKRFVNDLRVDPLRSIVMIVPFEEGAAYYAHPSEVYMWNDYYQYYIPVVMDDVARKLFIIY